MPAYLRPSDAIHADALLPGDPARAMALAQELLEQPKMSNHSRGLWGYSGRTPGGAELTIQSTGIGGPSAAVVLGELAELGVRRAVRVGTCRALDPGLELGDLLAASEAAGADAATGGLRVEDPVAPDPALGTAVESALAEAGGRAARIASTGFDDPEREWPGEVAAVDLTTAPLLAIGHRLGLAAAALLVVAETGAGEQIDDERLAEASLRAGRAAVAALSSSA
jgi:uridine phosphorylase